MGERDVHGKEFPSKTHFHYRAFLAAPRKARLKYGCLPMKPHPCCFVCQVVRELLSHSDNDPTHKAIRGPLHFYPLALEAVRKS
jgi:hypothetical protein